MAMTDVIIVGAGLSGLTAAAQLSTAGRSVIVVDKGRSVGGRMATRRIGPGRADHGAQFFTVRDDTFAAMVAEWEAAGQVYVWGHGWGDGSQDRSHQDGHPRYASQGGMNALTKHMAAQLPDQVEIRTGVRITAADPTENGWRLTASDGATLTTDALIMTAPVPQALALVAVHLTSADRQALERISYGPCVCGLFWVAGDLTLPEPGAVQRPNATFSWMADNKAKGISPQARIVTVHANPQWSRQHFDADPETTLNHLYEPLTTFAAGALTVKERQLKKWRYAIPQVTHDQRTLIAEGVPPLAFAGDAFGGPRVEGAVLSGYHTGRVLSES